MTSIDFHHIRPLEGDRRYGFEEFICQLARRENVPDDWEFRRVEGAGGDGGVEAYWLQSDGIEHGYQAKYFLATKAIDWGQIDKSVKSALEQHPKLTSYTIALACDLTDRSGKEGKGKTGWDHWKTHKIEWEELAKAKGMTVEFVHWTKSQIIDKLASDLAKRGLALFWFDAELLDDKWFREHFSRSQADLDDRYHPEDHVRLSLEEVFGGLARSQAYLQFLHKWFSAVPSSADLVKQFRGYGMPVDENLVSTLCQECDDLHRIDESLDEYGVNEFPITDWASTLLRASKAVGLLRKEIEVSDGFRNTDDKRDAARYLGEIDRHLKTTPFHLSGGQHQLYVEADVRRMLLVVGEAGSGKSHLFASVVSSMLDAGMPALLLLGQYFQGTDLRHDLLRTLDMANRTFDEVLGALNAAGETAKTRLVLLIDALNEAENLRKWGGQLAGLLQDMLRYEWLAVGMSVRPEYEDHLIPSNVLDICARIECGGVLLPDEQEQAVVQYFEKRGITRPAVPWLAPEFSNFLFLRTCCDALKEQNYHEFPRGLRGSKQVLKFYINSIDHKLRAQFPGADIPLNALSCSLRAIAELMAGSKLDYVTKEMAVQLCEHAFGHRGPSDRIDWYHLLASEGIFRKDHLFDPDSDDPLDFGQEVFRFTYQRFSDHLVVEALLNDVDAIQGAFAPNEPLGFIFVNSRYWTWESLIEALAVQIPEKYPGIELPDVVPSEYVHATMDVFKESLLWRSDSAFTDRTLELFDQLATEWDDPRADILLKLATLQAHPWNARLLHNILQRFTMPERDAVWTVNINQMADDERLAIWELIRWSTAARLDQAETETLRLAAIALGWSLTSSNRNIRDKATKALSSIFSSRPEVLPGIVRDFSDVDDLYVMERVCAAALGAVTRGIEKEHVVAAAEAVYESVFKPETPYLHIILRDYARAIVEYAKYLGCLSTEIDLAKCRPPYHSSWPLTDITEDELKAIAERAGDTQILHSSQQMMGDFGTYEIAPLMNHVSIR